MLNLLVGYVQAIITWAFLSDGLEAYKEQKPLPNWTAAVTVLVGAFLFAILLQPAPLLGYDWFKVFWQAQQTLFWYPPWTELLVRPLAYLPWRWGLAFSNGFTVAAVAVATFYVSKNWWGYLAAVMAVVNPIIFVLLWDGMIDGWSLLGFLLLPWGVPLLIIKPTLGAFALLTRKSWFFAGVVFAIITLLLWGFWPAQSISLHVIEDYKHPAAAGWFVLSWPIGIVGLIMLLFTNRRDPFQMIAVGGFLMPYVFPYHFVLLFPALGRLQHFRQLILWLLSWTLVLPFALPEMWNYIVYLFPLAAWLLLREQDENVETWLAFLKRQFRRLSPELN